MQTKIGKTVLRLVTGDIADQDTDAVVTAAHWRLNKGNGTDGTIHTKGGPEFYEKCRRIGGCPIGDAVITTGGDLKARHVIHAVGPVWRGGDEHEPELLASAYRRSLQVAAQNQLHSISIPSISTGAFIYPIRLAGQLLSRRLFSFWRRSSTTSTRFGWFFTRGRTTRHTRCSQMPLSRYFWEELHMDLPNQSSQKNVIPLKNCHGRILWINPCQN